MPRGVLKKMRFPYARITKKNDGMATQEVAKYL